MEHELLKAKYQDETFEAVVDYEEEEIVIRYHNDQLDAFQYEPERSWKIFRFCR